MYLLKRHAALWRALAIHLDTKPKSLSAAERRSQRLEFYHVELPSLGKDLEHGLQGTFLLSSPFFKRQRGSALPRFLYEFFILIFEKDGSIREYPEGIRDLRQLLMMFYKFEMPLDQKLVNEANQAFIDRDKEVKTTDYPWGLEQVRLNFLSLMPSDPLDIRPHHSDGASAHGYNNNEKRYVKRVMYPLMDTYGANYFFNSSLHAHNWASSSKTVVAPQRSKTTQVPKDSRGPRTICMEPHELMFIQKGLQVKLYDHIENHSPARGYVNFTDQTVNQRLAFVGSLNRSIATIDLKDASDMVPWDLIRLLVPPEWYVALKATRSAETLIDGKIVALNKYAPMGSALCFPIEAMLFWAICKTVAPQVWVYGDDIIVDIDYAHECIKALESYGLRINHSKTLIEGFFRESCGADYYKGMDITYLKCKSYDNLSYVPFCNLITERYGLELAHKFLDEASKPHEVYRQPLSMASKPSPLVFYTDRLCSSDVFFRRRWNGDLQVFEKRRLSSSTIRKETSRETYNGYRQLDDDMLFDWHTIACSDIEPVSDRVFEILGRDLFYPRTGQVLPVHREAMRQAAYPAIKYAWGSDYSDS